MNVARPSRRATTATIATTSPQRGSPRRAASEERASSAQATPGPRSFKNRRPAPSATMPRRYGLSRRRTSFQDQGGAGSLADPADRDEAEERSEREDAEPDRRVEPREGKLDAADRDRSRDEDEERSSVAEQELAGRRHAAHMVISGAVSENLRVQE